MISVITCSVNSELLRKLKTNIAATIGVEYEFLAFENRAIKMGICEAYNSCAKKAKYPYLVFVHEDVIFRSLAWGKELVEFEKANKNVGIIGVAGSVSAPRSFISWGDNPPTDRCHIWQHDPMKKTLLFLENNPGKEKYSEVVNLDGVFLFSKRDTWEKHPFDSASFPGFHLYDADFSLSVTQVKKNYVCHCVDIEHLSNASGVDIKMYFDSLRVFHKKWRNKLPIIVRQPNIKNRRGLIMREIYNLEFLLTKYIHFYGRNTAYINLFRHEPLILLIVILRSAPGISKLLRLVQ